MSKEERKKKTPPSWLPYIWVKSVDAALKKAKAAGGKVVSGAMDVMDQGRMAVVQDPGGAVIGLWQGRKHRGATARDSAGTIAWHDLNTRKAKAAGAFYTKVFGWKRQDMKMEQGAYHLFTLGKGNAGGMWPNAMKQLPNSWLTYWQVKNCAATVTKVKRLGGRVLMGTTPVPGMLRFAVVTDPQRAAFGVIEFER